MTISPCLQRRVAFRMVAGQAMEISEWDSALAVRAGDMHGCRERRERHAHVGRVGGDAVLAGAEDGVDAVHPADGRAAAAGFAFVAGRAGVVKVIAPGPLQQVAAGGRCVAQLRRGAGQDRAGQQRIPRRDPIVVGNGAVGHQSADAQAAGLRRLDGVQAGQAGDVDQPRRALDIVFHQVDQVGAAGDNAGGRLRRRRVTAPARSSGRA